MAARVRVHFHLTRRVFVVSERTAKGWRVVEYVPRVCLDHAEFVVSAKGRDYCRAKGMRWVHAWAEGERCLCDAPKDGEDVVYNPFRNDEFVGTGGRPVRTCAHASFTTAGEGRARVAITRVHGVGE